MDYYLLNACVMLAQELAYSEACKFWSPLEPREAADLSQEFFFSLFCYSEMCILQTNTKLYAAEKNCNRSWKNLNSQWADVDSLDCVSQAQTQVPPPRGPLSFLPMDPVSAWWSPRTPSRSSGLVCVFRLHWVLVAGHGPFPVVARGGRPPWRSAGLSWWLLLPGSTGLGVVVLGLCCSSACRLFLDQGSNSWPQHWR